MSGMTLGERIKEKREIRGYTQKELGLKVGVGGTNIRAIEAGRAEPSYRVFTELGLALNVSLDWLAKGIEDSSVISSISKSYIRVRLDRTLDLLQDSDMEILQATADAMASKYKQANIPISAV